MRRELLLIGEMIEAASQAQSLVDGIDLATLSADRQRRDALLWNFTVLGEAATQLDEPPFPLLDVTQVVANNGCPPEGGGAGPLPFPGAHSGTRGRGIAAGDDGGRLGDGFLTHACRSDAAAPSGSHAAQLLLQQRHMERA